MHPTRRTRIHPKGLQSPLEVRPTGRQGRIKAPFAGTICSTPFLKLLLFEHGREALNRLRGRGILRSWALQSRRHQRSGAPVAPQNSELCACYIWTRRERPPCALEVSGEKSRLAPLRYPCPLDRGKPNLAPALSMQQLVGYSPGSSLAQSPTASSSAVLLIWRTTQKRKAPICSRATVIPCALASSMICMGSGPLGRSPSLSVGACALAASSACLRNSVGSMPCSVRISSSSWLLYWVTFDLSFLSPTQRGSSPAIDYKQSAPPEPGVGQLSLGLYSPECVEEEFCEVRGSNLRHLVSNEAAIVSG